MAESIAALEEENADLQHEGSITMTFDLEKHQVRWIIRNLDQIAHTLESLEETFAELYGEDDDLRTQYLPNIQTWVGATGQVLINRHQIEINTQAADQIAALEEENADLQHEIVDLRNELGYHKPRIKT